MFHATIYKWGNDMELTLHDDYVYTTMLDLNLEQQKLNALRMQGYIENQFLDKETKGFSESTPITTKLYDKYNYLMYPLVGMGTLYENIREIFHICAREQNFGLDLFDEYHMQCWLNVYNKDDFIDWHGHWPSKWSSWHGFYCVNVEPESNTTYMIRETKQHIKIDSKNNLLVLSPSGRDSHKSSKWNYDEPRITVAFDIVPTMLLQEWKNPFYGQPNHWIPI
jgi:hypothetical protein